MLLKLRLAKLVFSGYLTNLCDYSPNQSNGNSFYINFDTNQLPAYYIYVNFIMNSLFPIFLKLDKLNTLIIGGGNVGLEKLEALLNNSPEANIILVSPEIKPEIQALAESNAKLTVVQRKFEWDDLNNVDILVCATDSKVLHKTIYQIAKRRKILINVADTPELCDFYLSSVVTKGELKIAISTNGKSPTFAKRMKEYLNEVLESDDINTLLENLANFRSKLKGDFSTKVKELNKITTTLAANQVEK